jgi:hypothetical protein
LVTRYRFLANIKGIQDGATDSARLEFETQATGGSASTRMEISSVGAIQFNTYGSGTHTGTSAYKLSVDSSGNIIETSIGAGAVDGSGTANTIPRWTDSDTIGDSLITVPSNTSVKINASGADAVRSLRIDGTNGSSEIAGFILENDGANAKVNLKYNIGNGTPATKVTLNHLGYVGINTTAPAIYLHNHGSALIGRTSGTTGGYVLSSYDLVLSNGNSGTVILLYNSAGAFQSSLIKYDTNCLKLGLNSSNSTNAISTATAVNVGSVGVGIGTVTPGALLEVYAASSLVATHVKSGTVISRLTANSTASDGVVGTSSAHDFLIQRAGSTRMTFSGSSVVVNDSGEDIDFRVEGDTDANLIRTDAANDRVGIGTNAPLSKFNVLGTQGNWRIDPDGVSNEIQVLSTTVANDGFRTFRLRTNETVFDTGGSERMRIKSDGKVGIGTDAPISKLQVQGGTAGMHVTDTYATSSGSLNLAYNDASDYGKIQAADSVAYRALLLNPSGGSVGIGTTPAQKLHVVGDAIKFERTDNAVTLQLYNNNASPADDAALGYLQFLGKDNDGTANLIHAEVRGGVQSNTNTAVSGYLAFLTTNNGTSVTEQMRIKADGNVGIGTNAPSELLEVKGNMTLRGATNLRYKIANDSNNNWSEIGNDGATGENTLEFFTGSSSVPSMSITNSKLVGIGTATPVYTLQGNGLNGGIIGVTRTSGSTTGTLGHVRFGNTNVDSDLANIKGVQDGATDSARLEFETQATGGSATARLTIKSDGVVDINSAKLKINGGSGTDGQVLTTDGAGGIAWETSPGAGSVDGSGTANYVAKWSDSDTIANSVLRDDGNRLAVGAAPSSGGGILHLKDVTSNQAKVTLESANAYNSWINFSAASNEMSIGYDQSTVGGFVFANADALNSNIRMVILSTGYVGVGTASPDTLFHMRGAAATLTLESTGNTDDPTIMLQRDNNTGLAARIQLDNSGGDVFFDNTYDNDNGDIYFRTKGTTKRVTIKGSGSVGIGTDAPSRPLHVYATSGNNYLTVQNTSASQAALQLMTGTTDANWVMYIPSSSTDLRLYRGADKVVFKADGNVGIGTDAPGQLLHVYKAGVLEPNFQSTTGRVGLQLNAGAAGDVSWILYSGYPAAGDFNIRESGVANHFVIKKTTGSVGIGTATPDSKLEIAGGGYNSSLKIKGSASHTGIQFEDSDGNTDGYVYAISDTIGFLDAGADWTIQSKNDDYIRFSTNGNTEHMRIKSDGNVGIGTDDPKAPVHLFSNGSANTQQTVLCLGSNTSNRPSLQFSESQNAGFDTGMSIEYRGDFGAGGANGLTINGLGADATTSGAAIATFLSGGSVGIGTTDPDSLLMVYKSGADSIIHVRGIASGADARVRINGYNSSELYLDRNGVGRFAFRRTTGTDDLSLLKLNDDYSDNSTIMFWDYSSGDVGIGQASASYKLDVNGTGRFNDYVWFKGGIRDDSGSAGSNGQVLTTNGSNAVTWTTAGSGTVTGSGTASYVPKFTSSTAIGNSALFDGGGNNIGIGTNNPQGQLQLHSTASAVQRLVFSNTNSNLNPQQRIEFWESAATSTSTNAHAAIEYVGSTAYESSDGTLLVKGYGSSADLAIAGFNRNGNVYLAMSGNKKVGINTTTPSTMLHVHSGDILITSGKQLISTNSYTQAPPAMLTTQGPSTGATSLGTGTWGIMMGPQHTRSTVANTYYPGIAFNHLLNNGGVVTYNNHPQAWIGTRLHDTPGSERAFLVFSTKGGTGVTASDVPLERMCIDPVDGFVGIGTTNPQVLLDVYTSDSDTARFESTSTSRSTVSIRSGSTGDAQIRFQNGASSKWSIGNDGGDSDKFKIAVGSGAFAAHEVFTITTSGSVGIGTGLDYYTSVGLHILVVIYIMGTLFLISQVILTRQGWDGMRVLANYK